MKFLKKTKRKLAGKVMLFLLLSVSILNTGCSKETPLPNSGGETIHSKDLKFKVSFDETFENTFYPSLVLGLSKLITNHAKEGSFELLKYELTTPSDGAELKIVMNASDLNSETTVNKTLEKKGEPVSITPKINWNYNRLRELKTPGIVNLSFKCFINDKEVDNKSLNVQYRSVNECVFGALEKGKFIDLNWMFGGYVNEDHPKIDELLREILKYKIVDSFGGYQGNEQQVYFQVFALWYHLQKNNVKYSNITDTSNPSQNIFTQNVRFFDEVYKNKQANCVDGTVFISSILRKIGLKPFLVLVPGHMYLGFYTHPDTRQGKFALLETTMVGLVDINEVRQENGITHGINKYRNLISNEYYNSFLNGNISIEQLRVHISLNVFQAALKANMKEFNEHINDFSKPNSDYAIIDIEQVRKIVQPIK